jgi:hypothetical protein
VASHEWILSAAAVQAAQGQDRPAGIERDILGLIAAHHLVLPASSAPSRGLEGQAHADAGGPHGGGHRIDGARRIAP